MKIIGADHTSYTVSNLDRSLEFYHDWLGLEIIHIRPNITLQYFRDIIAFPDAVVKGALLAIPGTNTKLELFEYVHPRGTEQNLRNNNPGSSHMAFYVDDLRELYDYLLTKGVQFRSPPIYLNEGPNIGGWALYMLDPDGITIELMQQAPQA
jgi:lactoylglutathione lyase